MKTMGIIKQIKHELATFILTRRKQHAKEQEGGKIGTLMPNKRWVYINLYSHIVYSSMCYLNWVLVISWFEAFNWLLVTKPQLRVFSSADNAL